VGDAGDVPPQQSGLREDLFDLRHDAGLHVVFAGIFVDGLLTQGDELDLAASASRTIKPTTPMAIVINTRVCSSTACLPNLETPNGDLKCVTRQ
jgi:hypothetical protein